METYETPDDKSIVSNIPGHALKDFVLENVIPEVKTLLNTIRSNVQRKGFFRPLIATVAVTCPKSSFNDTELPKDFGNL